MGLLINEGIPEFFPQGVYYSLKKGEGRGNAVGGGGGGGGRDSYESAHLKAYLAM